MGALRKGSGFPYGCTAEPWDGREGLGLGCLSVCLSCPFLLQSTGYLGRIASTVESMTGTGLYVCWEFPKYTPSHTSSQENETPVYLPF